VLVLACLGAALRSERGRGRQQKYDWRNSVWHLFQISLTIDVEEGFPKK